VSYGIGVQWSSHLMYTRRSPMTRTVRGITPAFGYGAPHLSAGGTSTLLNNALLGAHYGLC
jgi:hypothetical protein